MDLLNVLNVFSTRKYGSVKPLNITGLTDYAQDPSILRQSGLLHYGKESHFGEETETEKRSGSW